MKPNTPKRTPKCVSIRNVGAVGEKKHAANLMSIKMDNSNPKNEKPCERGCLNKDSTFRRLWTDHTDVKMAHAADLGGQVDLDQINPASDLLIHQNHHWEIPPRTARRLDALHYTRPMRVAVTSPRPRQTC